MELRLLLPTVNASLNALATLFLLLGWRAIQARSEKEHQKMMLAALCCSALFFGSYVTYHALFPGVTRYHKEGFIRLLYFFILGTHTPLAVVILPFSLKAVWHAYHRDFHRHTRITRWLLPVWLYVSVTGVVIYLMLYIF